MKPMLQGRRGAQTLLLVLSCVWAFGFSSAACAQEWVSIRDVDLKVQEGSVLDFSAFRPGPGLRKGASDDAEALSAGGRRLLCGSFALTPAGGPLPTHEEATEIARQMRMRGYNVARMHYVDAMLMTGRAADFDFDPEQTDRFFFLLAAFKKEGIGWVVDMVSSVNGAYGGVLPHRWVNRHDLMMRLYYDPEARAHWATLVERLYQRVNPYTGKSTLADPALVGVIGVNEGGLHFLVGFKKDHYPAELQAPFNDWLKKRYKNDAALKTAWGSDLGLGESLDKGSVQLPERKMAEGARMRDFLRFGVSLEQELYTWMRGELGRMGYNGPFANYNNWHFVNADLSRSVMNWVDFHEYHDEPSGDYGPGAKIVGDSSLSGLAAYVRRTAFARQAGKPFFVSEYSQAFWNPWRHEAGLVFPAYASLQGWQGICAFGDTPVELKYWGSSAARKKALFPFSVGLDPIMVANERISAAAFLRGDVAESSHTTDFFLTESEAFGQGALSAQVSDAVSKNALIGKVRLNVLADNATPAAKQRTTWLRNTQVKKRFYYLLGLGNDVTMDVDGASPVSSDTGQIMLDPRARTFVLNTPRLVAASLPQPMTTNVGKFVLQALDGPVGMAVISVDGKSLATSKRMLIVVSSDARNSGMKFRDENETVLEAVGELPVQIRKASVHLQIPIGQPTGAEKVYSVRLNGSRIRELALKLENGNAELLLSNVDPAWGPIMYFELVR